MNITLKNVKIVAKLSEETMCYTADLCLDGKKVASASNRGQGGSDDIFFTDPKARKKIEAYCAKQPPMPNPYDPKKPFPMDLELFISGLLDKHQEAEHQKKVLAQKKRWCKTETVFRLKGDTEGSYRALKVAFSPTIKTQLQKKYGDKIVEILNETIEL